MDVDERRKIDVGIGYEKARRVRGRKTELRPHGHLARDDDPSGHLVVTGDVESFHFAREADMFGFFEMCGNEHGINPDYWGEKIQGSAKWRTHSPELFAQLVVEHFWERRHSYEGDTAALWRAIREDVLIHAEYAVAARDALMSFQHWDRQAGTFEFSDAWEWSFLDADWHYLRSLHAIVWGIRKYRAAKAES